MASKTSRHKTQSLAALRKSLQQQLCDKGADVAHFQDQIDNYIFLVKQLRAMQADIRKNGLQVDAMSAVGKKYKKENPAIKMIVIYTKEERALLRDMGLTTDSCRPLEDEESDL